MKAEHVDVVIVGAGLSGIGAACRLQRECPHKRYVIIEARAAMGGTWDLFRYPGIRSDSDMHTLGYDFKPWREEKAIADGPSILRYIKETAAEYGVDKNIRYQQRLRHANWSSNNACWQLEIASGDGDNVVRLSCSFLFMCSGYYSYEQGYTPVFKQQNQFNGTIIHPQHWPKNFNYRDKRVVVIGSGATAVTLVPEMAQAAAHVVMLQRTPTYIVSMPARDRVANWLRKLLPINWAYRLTRWKNIVFQQFIYRRSRKKPERIKKVLLKRVQKALGAHADIDRDFTPPYRPWDQRMCLVPDSDLFEAINSGKASVVTGQIESFTGNGIELVGGQQLQADVIVTATGLQLVVLGGATFSIDKQVIDFADTITYKGIMFSTVPNLVSTFGYTNASWTLRADLIAEYVCRVLKYMDAKQVDYCIPTLTTTERQMATKPWFNDFTPGYIQRDVDRFPKQGDHSPWTNTQNYKNDKKLFRKDPIDDGNLCFHHRQSVAEVDAIELQSVG